MPDQLQNIIDFNSSPNWRARAGRPETDPSNHLNTMAVISDRSKQAVSDFRDRKAAIESDDRLTSKGKADEIAKAAKDIGDRLKAEADKMISLRRSRDSKLATEKAEVSDFEKLRLQMRGQEIRADFAATVGNDLLKAEQAAREAVESGDSETLDAILGASPFWASRPGQEVMEQLREARKEMDDPNLSQETRDYRDAVSDADQALQTAAEIILAESGAERPDPIKEIAIGGSNE